MMNVIKPKRLLMGLMTVGVACSLPTFAQAGPMNKICSECHTMHNSQGAEAFPGSDKPYGDANAQLLIVDCVGCHIDGGAVNNGTTRTPQVGGANAPASMLAGGYFSNGAADQSKTHNITGYSDGIDTLSPDIAGDPPGWEGTDGAWAGNGTDKRVTCSGTGTSTNSSYTSGCHRGGGHHTNNSRGTVADGSTVGKSFRFLSGVKGREDAEWELTNSSADHNQYYAVLTGDLDDQLETVNGLCARCHGDFHQAADQDSGGEWIRHPTDIDLAASASEHQNYGTYDPLVPVGTNVAAMTLVDGDVQTPGNGIVLCISCHRAHGSAYDDLLRWDYSDMVAGSTAEPGTGCFKCHRDKD